MSSSFLPTFRQFPTGDEHNLEKQLVNFHTQTNTAVNQRTIGIFDLHVTGKSDSIPNGERWFPTAAQSGTPQKLRDGFRLVVQVSDAVLVVLHNIPLINQVTRLYGAFQDAGGIWWSLPYVDLLSATNQINVRVSSTQIIVTKGAGAPPSVNNGIVVLEYL